jgi:NAD-specific glutamate dehydrogenase
MGVVEVAHHTGTPLPRSAALLRPRRAPAPRLAARPARGAAGADKWSKIAVGGLVMDLRQAQRDLTERYVRLRAGAPRLGVDAFLARTPNVIRRYDEALARIEADDELSLASAGVVVRLIAQAR